MQKKEIADAIQDLKGVKSIQRKVIDTTKTSETNIMHLRREWTTMEILSKYNKRASEQLQNTRPIVKPRVPRAMRAPIPLPF